MHDLHLANKIFNLILEYAQKNQLKTISLASIELGRIIEHSEAINSQNLIFHLKNLARGTIAKNSKFKIKKVSENNFWKLVVIEGER